MDDQHLRDLREADKLLRQADQELATERDRRYTELRLADLESKKIALDSADKILELHNGLIRRLDSQGETFATKDDLQNLEKQFQHHSGGSEAEDLTMARVVTVVAIVVAAIGSIAAILVGAFT